MSMKTIWTRLTTQRSSISSYQTNLLLLLYAAGSDYETTTGMVTFEPNDSDMGRQCATVPITDDTLGNEPNELFSVTFTSANPAGSFPPDGSEACVTIIDDDGT